MKKLLATLAMATAAPVYAACEVVSDAANDAAPQHDITSVTMSSDGDTLTASVTVFELAVPTADTDYRVHWFNDNGAGYYIGFWLIAGNGIEGLYSTEWGTWDGNSYSLVEEATLEYEIEGSTIHITAPLMTVGYPQRLSGIGAQTDFWAAGADPQLDTTDSTGEYTIGDDCGKSEELKGGLASDGRYFSGGAGSFGMIALLAGLAGLRRRRH